MSTLSFGPMLPHIKGRLTMPFHKGMALPTGPFPPKALCLGLALSGLAFSLLAVGPVWAEDGALPPPTPLLGEGAPEGNAATAPERTGPAPSARPHGRVYGVAPPSTYPADTWQGRTVALVRVLDRLDSSTHVLQIPVGSDAQFRTLTLHVAACLERPPTLPADNAVRLHLEETALDAATAQKSPPVGGKEASETPARITPPYDGWMFSAEPAVGLYGSPLYAVRLITCQGGAVAPRLAPLAPAEAPRLSAMGRGGYSGGAGGEGGARGAQDDDGATSLLPENTPPDAAATPMAPPVPVSPAITQPDTSAPLSLTP
ncbi:DUF2155 domain-containing protein [Formicincola oecophyllae]|uniref:DUF2155 domain-containing protein n=1 Tax=Formicincola oecophyllae TaxID=2558361 RepID=A0A4Y6UAK9_9PROT|nr:DUF2155 domain-containing protein [Formicincola oecophyllae]QDH13487.1 DUF2155 domain-containing protein [Formicincola oecophyllae]